MVGEKRWPEKERCLIEALDGLRETLGEAQEAHRETLLTMWHLANLYRRQGRLDEAIDLYTSGAQVCARTRGDGSTFTAKFLNSLARTLRESGRRDEARDCAIGAIAAHRQWTDRTEVTALDLYTYAWLLLTCEPADVRDPEAALPIAQNAVALFEESGGSTTFWGKAGYTHDALALAYYMSGDLQNAVFTQRDAINLLPPTESRYRIMYETKLAYFLLQMGNDDAAEQVLSPARVRVSEDHGDRQADVAERMTDLAMILLRQEEYPTYGRLCGEIRAVQMGFVPRSPHRFVGPAENLASVLLKERRFERAELLLRACLQIQEFALPQDDWRIAHTMSLLGQSLSGLGRFEEAEPLLVNGHDNLKANAAARADRVDEALGRIVELYEVWDRPTEAAKWRARQE